MNIRFVVSVRSGRNPLRVDLVFLFCYRDRVGVSAADVRQPPVFVRLSVFLISVFLLLLFALFYILFVCVTVFRGRLADNSCYFRYLDGFRVDFRFC